MDKLLGWITNYLIRESIIKKEDEEIYAYSFRVVFLMAVTIAIIIALSLYLNCLLESLAFLAFLAPLRTYAGGYHADSQWLCFILYIVLNFSAVALSSIIPNEGYMLLMLVALPLSVLIIFFLAPVAAQNKPLDEDEIKNYKKISIYVVLVESLLIVAVFSLFGSMPGIYLSGTLGVLVAAISLVAEKIRINLEGGDLSYEIKREV